MDFRSLEWQRQIVGRQKLRDLFALPTAPEHLDRPAVFLPCAYFLSQRNDIPQGAPYWQESPLVGPHDRRSAGQVLDQTRRLRLLRPPRPEQIRPAPQRRRRKTRQGRARAALAASILFLQEDFLRLGPETLPPLGLRPALEVSIIEPDQRVGDLPGPHQTSEACTR